VERILTQDEIDELLSAFGDGDADGRDHSFADTQSPGVLHNLKNIAGIDLTKGQNYRKWRIANLDIIFNAFARYYGISLSNCLQRSVAIQKGEVVSKLFEEFVADIENAGVFGIFTLEPLKGSGVFVFDKTLCFSLVEMLLGVSPESDFIVPERELTAIEANVIRNLISEGCQVLNRAFSPLDQINSEITRVETSRKMLNLLSPDTEVIQVSYSVHVGELSREIMMVIPCFSLEPFREVFRGEAFRISERKKESGWADYLERELMDMEISISAAWVELFLTIQEILSLEDGDIITFDFDEFTPVKVLVGQKKKLIAQPGLSDGKKAVRILKQESLGA